MDTAVNYEMRAAESDDEINVGCTMSMEEILEERKIALKRWSYGKSWLEYRGMEVSLEGGPDQDEIEFNEGIYETLEEVFEIIDEMGDDEEGVPEAVRIAWEGWLESEEAARI